MANSNITKQALAKALRELMEETTFDKIQVAHICERCDMNRKSFYYHFKDKYDLLNWIFDTEISEVIKNNSDIEKLQQFVVAIRGVCNYFYENRNFYRKALKIQGQNSFSEHFKEYIRPYLKARLTYMAGEEEIDEFTLDFFVDAAVCAIERWLLDKNCIPPDEFVAKIVRLVQQSINTLQREFNQKK